MLPRFNTLGYTRISFKFLVITSVITAITFGLLLFWFSCRQEEHIMEQVRKQAAILHKQIVLTRQWVAEHGSLLLPKSAEIRPNPFLPDPEVLGSDGVTYVRISPSILTKSLSEKAMKNDLYSFKITNTDQMNPSNKPDDFETEALNIFRTSANEGIFRIEENKGKTVFRYVAPLKTNEQCLQCHMAQGYKAGDVGGCLSIYIPMDEARAVIDRNRLILLTGGMGFAGFLVVLLFVPARALFFKPIGQIRTAMSRLTSEKESLENTLNRGDELKEITEFCYLLDKKLKDHHEELERNIAEATRDLSETNQNLADANRELERLNRAKSDFFSDISHELRTPLTSIKGATDILLRKSSCESPEYLDIIKRNTDHLIKIVADFLEYSRIEAGELELEISEASLKEVAEDAIISQKASAQKRSVNLVLISPEDRIFTFDTKSLYQVMSNLLSNAIKFSPPNGTVTVEIVFSSTGTEVSVKDEGPGIERAYHETIFRKFYQIKDQNRVRLNQGSSGIGLAICKGLVEAHDGRIWVHSRPGRGSCFSFFIPYRVKGREERK
ncbi:ATP-binding protein [Desulfomonile tiedjei]|uniref:histidine kinase n=1 Tax=Desulfomonile tiedjei (strain ATCC 49306 / DSM 6799 / DCB-1) TaxID=706587 RepID=I4C0J4_DESTA|nr:ATP-binding protein [Desulfomonile tiedjei]AFM23085.1 signal transduction histidine kinase [Desulfomonile tiedjei DSM 6799]